MGSFCFVQGLKGGALTRYDDGCQTRSFCFVDDLIEGMIRLMNGAHTGPINIGNPTEFTIRQLAEMVREMINPELELICKPLPQDDPLQRQPIIDLAQKELGWTPSVALDKGLEPTIAYFKELILEA